MKVDHCQNAWLRLESQHSLEVCLILPSGAMHHQSTLVIPYKVSMDMTSDKNVWNDWNHHPILRLRRKRRLPTPRGGQVPPLTHSPHSHLRFGIADGPKRGYVIVNALSVLGKYPDAMKAEVAGISNKYGIRIVLLYLRIQGWLGLCWSDGVMVSGEHHNIYPIGYIF